MGKRKGKRKKKTRQARGGISHNGIFAEYHEPRPPRESGGSWGRRRKPGDMG